MRILCWNVNGLRSIIQKHANLQEFLESLNADILCFQETKLSRLELDITLARPEGFHAFYNFSKVRNGYSGVATFCRKNHTAINVADKIDLLHETNQFTREEMKLLNSEGRFLLTDHEAFVVLNIYFPAIRNPERLQYKLLFHQLIQEKVKELFHDQRQIILVGDINIAHRPIDHSDPHMDKEHPCRIWMDNFLGDATKKDRLVDCFRYFNPDKKNVYTCWNTKTGARQTNYGTRIDYILASPQLLTESFSTCSILSDVEGSDHCPVVAELMDDTILRSCLQPDSSCTNFWPQFSGRQQSLSQYLAKSSTKTTIKEKQVIKRTSSQTTLLSYVTKRPKVVCNTKETNDNQGLRSNHDLLQSNQDLHSNPNRNKESVNQLADVWKQILPGKPPDAPLCDGHSKPCVLRRVVKQGKNYGKKFYVCSLPEGRKDDLLSRCNFFQWKT